MYDLTDLILSAVLTGAVIAVIDWQLHRRLLGLRLEQVEELQGQLQQAVKTRHFEHLAKAYRGDLLHQAYVHLDPKECPKLHAQIERELGLHNTCSHQFRKVTEEGHVTYGVCDWCQYKVTEQEMDRHTHETCLHDWVVECEANGWRSNCRHCGLKAQGSGQ